MKIKILNIFDSSTINIGDLVTFSDIAIKRFKIKFIGGRLPLYSKVVGYDKYSIIIKTSLISRCKEADVVETTNLDGYVYLREFLRKYYLFKLL